MKMFKKLFAVLMLVVGLFVMPAQAEDAGAYFHIGGIEFTYPLSNASVISLYDYWKAEGLLGAETRLASWKALNMNFGAVTSFKANGMPFVSLDVDFAQLIAMSPPFLAKVGLWYGRDFKANENRAGVKAAMPLW
jgi:hypothetical protein